ncbi:TetR/AcrR family transcriptional regulator [Echinicola jeungdonensis]|uniref:TetR/AcrR family transcriptional regulator n=1 Tax=Echinicola jeungdonensis TaxID=709343 RepID=A0ABV5J6Z2_9BACT|nr:TetR/AcrR family transcriptional regulator [Echinicola jeungdonensis]MDN3670773.1 TetR/AcrR family transcriptional regulator [Echinicola jeungdonensis]
MGKLERQQKEKDILEAAIKLFSSKGYHTTKMDEVAKQAKMSKGLIYFYYKNKEDLYMAVTKKAFEELKNIFKETQKAKGKNGISLITDLVNNFLSFSKGNRMYHEAILNFMGIMALYNDNSKRKQIDPLILESPHFSHLLEIHHEPAKIGIQIISLGVRDGSMRPDLQPEITFYTIWTMLIGYERLRGPIEYEHKEVKISQENWKNGFIKLLHDMLKGTIQAQKPKAVQGSLF